MATSLWLQYAAAGKIVLDGAGMAAPVKGALYAPGQGRRAEHASQFGALEVITEDIQIDLAGTYRQMSDWVSLVNGQLETMRSGAWHNATGGPLMVCWQEPDEGGAYYWFARLLDARLTMDAHGLAQRKLGQQLVTLTITREDRWEYSNTRTYLSINLPEGGTQLDYGGLMNHKDNGAGHSNWGWIHPAAMGGDLLSRAALQVQLDSGKLVGDVYVGLGWSDIPAPDVRYMLPTLEESAFSAGAGVTRTGQASAAASGGLYADFMWSAAGETKVMSGSIPADLYARGLARERPFKPMARLNAGITAADLWLKARVLLGGSSAVLYETEWFLYRSGSQLIEFPPVYLPPAGIEENTQMDLAIYALKSGGGAITLALDYVQLWPVDGGFRKYTMLYYPSSEGQLIDSGFWGGVSWANAAYTQRRAAVVAHGAPLALLPGRSVVVAVANLVNGVSWLIDDKMTVILNQVVSRRMI